LAMTMFLEGCQWPITLLSFICFYDWEFFDSVSGSSKREVKHRCAQQLLSCSTRNLRESSTGVHNCFQVAAPILL
jgi:hypothetical protein